MPSSGAWRDAEYRRNREQLLRDRPACACPGCAGTHHPHGRPCPRVATSADHVVPRSMGGGHGLDNMRPLCRSCNSQLGLLVHPRRNRGSASRQW